ncbi:MAG TPA: YihY/virulence factor BrkB family protein [Pyrinomonadaceae bacterium]|jgi:membrane protein|nr:YihY/virulence factor BrkB family protein [Pyrinomonadaceae bacterium]
MWSLSGLSFKEFGKRVWKEIQADDVFGDAAKLAYYFLLALFPLLIFLTSTMGLVLGSGTGMRHALFNYLSQVMPSSAFELIDKTMWEVSSASGAGKLSFGLLAALWASASGVGAMMQSLNTAYDSSETRPWWKQRLVALGLTVALSISIIGAVVVIFGGSKIAEHLGASYGFSDAFIITWKVLQWPIALIFMLLAFALIYYFAPDLRDQDWKWISPGSAIGVVLWLLVSFAFKGYLHFFNSYSKTYGSLGAVIVLMLWLYLTGAAVLIGGEVNAEIENVAAKRGAADAQRKGQNTSKRPSK